MNVSGTYGPGDSIDLHVGAQSMYRLTYAEVRELVCQNLMFGGKKMREEVKKWLDCEEVEQVAQVISPEGSSGDNAQIITKGRQ